MNDHELDRLIASTAFVQDASLDGLDLDAAETELLEEIMSTANPPAPGTTSPAPDTPDATLAPLVSRRPRPPRRRWLAIAAGVVTIAAAAGVVALRTTGDDGGDANVQAGAQPTAITPMILDPVPAGLGPTEATPGEGSDPAPPHVGATDTWVYGDLTATALTNDVVLSVASTAPEGEVLGEDVTVRGQAGTLCSPGPEQCDFGNNFTSVSWTEAPGVHVGVSSRTFDGDQVLAIAEGLVVDGTTVELGDLPAGMATPPKVGEVFSDWNWSFSVSYQTPSAVDASVAVSTRPMTEARRAYDLWLSGPREDIVQGHPATFEDIDGAYVLTWEPVPGQLVEVLTNGLDEAAAREAADSVRPATGAEWAQVQEDAANAPTPEMPPGDDTEPAGALSRDLADGSTTVTGWRTEDGDLCYEVTVDFVVSSNLCHGDPAAMALGVSPGNDDGELSWDVPAVVGDAPVGTVSIDGGEATFGEELEGGRQFVWEYPGGEMPDTLTFRNAAGDEIGTAEVVVF